METVKNNVRKNIIISQRLNDMAEEIAKQKGIRTFTAVVEQAIALLHSKTIDYKVLSAKIPTGLSAEELGRLRVEQKLAEKKAEQDLKEEAKVKICKHSLMGDVVEQDGYKYCVFQGHSKFSSGENKVPLMQVDELLAKTTLFRPNKEAVFKSRPDLAKELGYVYNKKEKVWVIN